MAPKPSLLFPFYIYPNADWVTLANIKKSTGTNVIVVINPASGSVSTTDPNYVQGIKNLQAAGILVLGYINTDRGNVSPAIVETQMGYYKNEYAVNGIFFDNMSVYSNEIEYYSGLAQSAKNFGFSHTAGNPGSSCDLGYTGVFTILNTYENAGLPSLTEIQSVCPLPQSQKYSITCHDTPSVSESYVLGIALYASYCFFTDQTEPNPYDRLPSYFSQEMALLQPVATSITLEVTSSHL